MGPLWSWSYGSWVCNYIYDQCLSPLMLWIQIPLRRGVLVTTLCDKVCKWLAAGWCFSLDTPDSITNKTDHQDITEILLAMALNTINQPTNQPTNQPISINSLAIIKTDQIQILFPALYKLWNCRHLNKKNLRELLYSNKTMIIHLIK